MTAIMFVGEIRAHVRAELAVKTGAPLSEIDDDMSLADIGLDSLGLIEVLMSLREQILADRGLSTDDVEDPEVLPWLETVGELIHYAASFVPIADSALAD